MCKNLEAVRKHAFTNSRDYGINIILWVTWGYWSLPRLSSAYIWIQLPELSNHSNQKPLSSWVILIAISISFSLGKFDLSNLLYFIPFLTTRRGWNRMWCIGDSGILCRLIHKSTLELHKAKLLILIVGVTKQNNTFISYKILLEFFR